MMKVKIFSSGENIYLTTKRMEKSNEIFQKHIQEGSRRKHYD